MSDQDSSMQLRVLLAFALSALVLIIFAPRARPPKPGDAGKGASSSKSALPAPAIQPARPSPPSGGGLSQPPLGGGISKIPRATPQNLAESKTVVENDLYAVVFSNRGGVARSWILKNYKDAKGQPLELVNSVAAEQLGWPFAAWTDDAAVRDKLNAALFTVTVTSPRAPATLTFEYNDGVLSARKELRFEHGSYVIQVASEVTTAGAAVPHELAWIGGFGDRTTPQASLNQQVILATGSVGGGNKVEHQRVKDKGEVKLLGPFAYAGLEDTFFATVFLPATESAISQVHTFKNEQPVAGGSSLPVTGVSVGGGSVNVLRAYVGPKDLDVLKSVSPDPRAAERRARGESVPTLGEIIDFGWFTIFALPLFISLKWVYHHIVPNYGWAIILATVVINFLLFPLKLKGMKSAMKMQKVAPQVKAIQEKYKKYKLNDPRRQEQNKEVMELYRKEGINPVGGCLPMVLQIPFLYAFYKVLSISIEMRHAPWILWIRDLSSPEESWFKVLPILMIATMVILQKMTPQTSADPVQQKMFMMMPLMFGVMFYNVSSGLVLYWLVGNVVQIGQQWYFNKHPIG